MTGERKSSGKTSRSFVSPPIGVKRGGRLLSKTAKPTSGTISSPPKAAVAATSARRDEAPRRRHALNDILRRKSGDGPAVTKDTPIPLHDVGLHNDLQQSAEASGVDVRMADRVAELERALAFAKEEQALLREQLVNLKGNVHSDQLADGEIREQVAEKQGQHHEEEGATTSSAEQSQEDLSIPSSRGPPNQHDDIIEQNYALRFQLAQLQDQLVLQSIEHRNSLDRASSHGDVEWNHLRSRLHASEKESQERLQQLLSLKSSISSLTRSDSQATDRELVESFTQLANRIREWALVSHALMQILDEPIVLGLSASGPLAAAKVFAESIQDTGVEYTEWRRATIRAIDHSKAAELVHEEKNKALQNIAGEITDLLGTLTSVTISPNTQSTLLGILSTAADLQRTLAQQKARYQVLFFRSIDGADPAFDKHRMDSINDLDDDMDDDAKVAGNEFLFCVFPCLQKFGDERGENLDVSNILLKARVCCGVG
ncbi:hypothetical protein FB567DRAFT_558690 [Paraphoma chrysanthemicola]|uniref:Uncharacterized protein n=1 Tax=Paraphoma chrysanthemicola TaxID=798071 RepID=A0A8K0RDR0_9PLEO|nr:hypothetical protein FB567DRAFT_558690 [Paraphoma chrysanthemicola]